MLTPDFDGYSDDDDAAHQAAPETFAGSVADVQGGRRFVGGLFREPPHADDADDADLEWLHGYTEDAPGTLADVLNTFGPGLYRIRTAPGYPADTGRRITVQVGRRKAAPSAPPNVTPEVPPANMERLRREATEAARADIEFEKDGLARDVRRLKLEVTDGEETLARARREADRLAAEANTLRAELAAAQTDAITARRALADESMRHATETAEAARAAADEIDGYRAEAAELRADMTVRDYELASARRGEGIPESNPLLDLAREAMPHMGGLFGGIAARLAVQPDTAAGSGSGAPAYTPTLSPAPLPMSSAYSGDGGTGFPATPPEPATPSFDAFSVGASGDGAAGLTALAADVATPTPDGGPLVAIARAVVSVMQGAASVTPAEIARLVERGQTAGAEPADWRELVSDLVGEAVKVKAAPEPLADLLAPLLAPFADQFARVLAMPDALALPLVMHEMGVAVPKGGRAYLGRLLTALKARL